MISGFSDIEWGSSIFIVCLHRRYDERVFRDYRYIGFNFSVDVDFTASRTSARLFPGGMDLHHRAFHSRGYSDRSGHGLYHYITQHEKARSEVDGVPRLIKPHDHGAIDFIIEGDIYAG